MEVKDFFGIDLNSDNESMKSEGLTERRSEFSTIGNKRNTLDIGFDKISAILDVATLKGNSSFVKKLALTSPYKNQ